MDAATHTAKSPVCPLNFILPLSRLSGGWGRGVVIYRSFACTCPTQEIYNMKKEERPERKKRKLVPYFRLADWE
jgi:hypothetical protein|tara:strand:- start:339 stop:560 length:222 start_codon:yes stop_codon:yes gene_type:complete